MSKIYLPFSSQESFVGGENRNHRNLVLPNQVAQAVNMRIYADRIEKAPGYENGSSTDHPGTAAECDMYPKLLLQKQWNEEDLIVVANGWNSQVGRFYRAPADLAAWVELGTFTTGQWYWCGITLGDAVAPQAVLVSCANLFGAVGIYNLVTDTPVQWNVPALAFRSMAHWQDRLWGVSGDNLLYYTPPRTSWAVDADDWEYITVGDGTSGCQAAVVVGQHLYVFKYNGIYRIEYLGASNATYRATLVTPDYGITRHGMFATIWGDKAVAFMDQYLQIRVFDGVSVRALQSDANVWDEMDDVYLAATRRWVFSYMVWAEEREILTVGFTNLYENWAYDINLRYGPPSETLTPAFCRMVPTHKITAGIHLSYDASATLEVEQYDKNYFCVAGSSANDLGCHLVRETPGAYYHAFGSGPTYHKYESYVELAPADLSRVVSGRPTNGRLPVTRLVTMDASSAGVNMELLLKYRDGEDAYNSGKTITLNQIDYERLKAGIKLSGMRPQILITDDGGEAAAWSLRRVDTAGYLKKARR
jgi:hypothetical protein